MASDTLEPTWTTGGCVTTAGALFGGPTLFTALDDDGAQTTAISSGHYEFGRWDLEAKTVTIEIPSSDLPSITFELQKL